MNGEISSTQPVSISGSTFNARDKNENCRKYIFKACENRHIRLIQAAD